MLGLGFAFSSLSEKPYLRFSVGNLAFFMGIQMLMILQGFVAYELTGKASSLAILSLSMALPLLVLSPFGGVAADMVSKRGMLIATAGIAASAAFSLSALIVSGEIAFWQQVGIGVLTGAVFAFHMPARHSSIPNLVPLAKLGNAVALQTGGMNLTRVAGPALAGALVGPTGLAMAFAVSGALCLGSMVSDLSMPVRESGPGRARAAVWHELRGGAAFVLSNRLIALLLTAGLLGPLFGFPLQQVLPVVAKDVFHRGPDALGVMSAVMGLGGILGAVFAGAMDGVRNKGLVMLSAGVFMAAAMAGLGISGQFMLGLLMLFAAGMGQVLFTTTNHALLQSHLPDEFRGRVLSLLTMSYGLMPFGVLPLAAAADAFGPSAAVAGAAFVLFGCLAVLFGLSSHLRHLTYPSSWTTGRFEGAEQGCAEPERLPA